MNIPQEMRLVRFGAFEANFTTGELRKNGIRLKLQDQPFQVLKLLLLRPGELVTREEIRRSLWSSGTFVDFDNGLNAAVNRLREALSDSAEEPKFIETLPRRGYRFIGALSEDADSDGRSSSRVGPLAEVGAPADARPTPSNAQERSLTSGQTVSHYRILAKLGSGGMAVVYKAEDLKLGRLVALKFVSESLVADATALKRFQHEAQVASALDHPNICTIYEIGDDAGLPFIAMQYLEGQTLDQYIGGKPMSVDEIAEIGGQIASALEAAHTAKIIHRDIKPGNIFVTQRGQVKILDFGIAKLSEELRTGVAGFSRSLTSTVSTVFTSPGARVGTFAYMSPEQERGEDLDARSDLYSLGLVLYDMATGWNSFSDKFAAVVHDAVGSNTPKLPADPLPPKLGTIIEKATQVDRNLRYQSAAEMRAELEVLKGLKRVERDTVPIPTPAAGKTRVRNVVMAVGFGVAAIGIAAFVYSHRGKALTEKDTIVLADFDNKTGDAVFDDALKQALAVDLGQSPFLNVLSDAKVAATLRLMGRSANQSVTGEVARELCRRVVSKALLAGSISALGNDYVIGLNAVNCATGDALVKEQIEARGKEQVLRALGNAATDMRGKLGESLASIQKFGTPIEEATTSSLEALKAYSLGRQALAAKGDVAAIPYYQQAVELDPQFALAFRALAVAYNNIGQATRASTNANRAFELRERVSERERYAIESLYYSAVTGELERGSQVYEVWKQSYPRDYLPSGNLGDNYMKQGLWEKAVVETEESISLDPDFSINYENRAWMQLALNRMDDARTTIEQASALNLDTCFLRLARYQGAFLRGDLENMQQQLAWATGRPGEEDWLLSAQSDTEAYFGRLGKAREFSEQAVNSARRADANEAAGLWQGTAALHEAEFGNAVPSVQRANAAMANAPGKYVQNVAALALARAGDSIHAQKLADGLNRDFPSDTIVQGYWLPAIRAAVALNENEAAKALDALRSASPYELGQNEPFQIGMMYPVYLRGQAYLLARRGNEAAAEFQKIIDHRGVMLNFPLGALAHLGLGRSYKLQGDTAKAQSAYRDFLTLWKDADPDIPILNEAKAEYAKLR